MNDNIDMGKMTSREIGDLMTEPLIERGKKIAKKKDPYIDYGNLPSKALIELGKQAFAEQNTEINKNN